MRVDTWQGQPRVGQGRRCYLGEGGRHRLVHMVHMEVAWGEVWHHFLGGVWHRLLGDAWGHVQGHGWERQRLRVVCMVSHRLQHRMIVCGGWLQYGLW